MRIHGENDFTIRMGDKSFEYIPFEFDFHQLLVEFIHMKFPLSLQYPSPSSMAYGMQFALLWLRF